MADSIIEHKVGDEINSPKNKQKIKILEMHQTQKESRLQKLDETAFEMAKKKLKKHPSIKKLVLPKKKTDSLFKKDHWQITHSKRKFYSPRNTE
jgi:hypothetical protein